MGLFSRGNKQGDQQSAQQQRSQNRSVLIRQLEVGADWTSSAEKSIEEVEAGGWRLDQLCALPYENRTVLVCLYRPARGAHTDQTATVPQQVSSSQETRQTTPSTVGSQQP